MLLLSLCLIGCTTMKAVERPTPALHSQIEAGDDVVVTTRAGKIYSLKVIQVSNDALIGSDQAGKRWKVPYEQIQAMEARRISGWKTAGMTAAVVIAALATVLVVGLRKLDDSINDVFEPE